MTKDSRLEWHFLEDDRKLLYSDGRVAKVGETLSSTGTPAVCSSGMHASARIIDAMGYSDGPWICRVRVSGKLRDGVDKFCGQNRKVLWMKRITRSDLRRAMRELGWKRTACSFGGPIASASYQDLRYEFSHTKGAANWLRGWARENGCPETR